MTTVVEAIQSLNSSAQFSTGENNINSIKWLNDTPEISKEDIQAEMDRLQAEYDAQEYARNRQPLYPAIGDQLDDLYHAGVFSAEMTATLKKVKDDNPK